MLIDMHIHTNLSPCSGMTIDDILDQAKIRGLDGVCITDHDTMNIRRQLSEGVQSNGICVLFGMEYSTALGDFLLFGPFETLPTDLPAEVLLRTVQETGGVAVAAHPFRIQRPTDEMVFQKKLCHAVESLNGRNSFAENTAVNDWLHRYDLIQCGGSDAHTPEEVGTFGTRFHSPILSRADLVHALKYNKCRPEIMTIAPPAMVTGTYTTENAR